MNEVKFIWHIIVPWIDCSGLTTITDATHGPGRKHLKDVCQFNRQGAIEIYSKLKIAFQQMVTLISPMKLGYHAKLNELLNR